MNLRNGPFSGAMLEVIGCYEPILGNGHLKKKKNFERWTNFTSFFLFTIEQFCVCLQWRYMNKDNGGFYVASIFHVKYIFHFVLSFSLGLSFKFPLQFLICLAAYFISCHQVLLPIPLFMGLFHPHSHGLVYIYIFFFAGKKKGRGGDLSWHLPPRRYHTTERHTCTWNITYVCIRKLVNHTHIWICN